MSSRSGCREAASRPRRRSRSWTGRRCRCSRTARRPFHDAACGQAFQEPEQEERKGTKRHEGVPKAFKCPSTGAQGK
jgi:hypothetical protein